MKIDKICGLYFSPTGTTRTVVNHLLQCAVRNYPGAQVEELDFTLPVNRINAPAFQSSDLVFVGLPVYAGRLPNLLLKFLSTFSGGGALAVPVVLFGNRSYGNALIELRDLLENTGFHTVAAAAFVGQHSFSDCLAQGRPDADDLERAEWFARDIAEEVNGLPSAESIMPVSVPGEGAPDYGGYYKPLDDTGHTVNMLKVKPVTMAACTSCKRCAEVCPMGAIDFRDVTNIPGICIKCNACIKVCPVQAKKLVDDSYLGHLRHLENTYTSRSEVVFFRHKMS